MARKLRWPQNTQFNSEQTCVDLPRKLRDPKAQGPTGHDPGAKGGGGRPRAHYKF